jgi:hypothetical protein
MLLLMEGRRGENAEGSRRVNIRYDGIAQEAGVPLDGTARAPAGTYTEMAVDKHPGKAISYLTYP